MVTSSSYRAPIGTGGYRAPGGVQQMTNLLEGRDPSAPNRVYPTHVPVASLRAFSSVQEALDGGRWLQAAVARWNGGYHEQAEAHCKAIGLDIQNAMSEGTGASGGYVTPAPIASTIIAVREQVGISRKALMVLPTAGDTLTVPRRTGGVTIYAPGEGNSITESSPTLGQVELITKKRAAYSELSQELSDDAIVNLADYIFLEFAHALAQQEDKELINGTGAGATYFGVRGLLNKIGTAGVATAATGHDTWGEIDMADMMACVGKLPDRYFEYGASWICSYSFYNQVMARLAFAAGGVGASEIMSGVGNVRSFAGYPVYLTSQMPTATAVSTKCCLFGAFSVAGILADRGPVRLTRSDDYKFQNDVIALKATSRYDINIYDHGDGSNAGAYVALSTAS